MAEVRVVIDPLRQAQLGGPDVMEVAEEADYLRTRQRIREALSTGEGLTVWITAETLTKRFDDLDSDPRVSVERFCLREELAAALGVPDVPDTIHDELITSRDLIHLARSNPRRSGESTEQWCVRALMGDTWSLEAPTETDAPQLLLQLAQDEYADLQELISWRLQTWGRASARSHLWTWLAEAPLHRSRCLLSVACSQPYGDAAIQWLTQDGFSLELIAQARDLLDHLPPLNTVPASVLGKVVRRRLGDALKTALHEQGPSALRRARARIPEELTAALNYLRTRTETGQLLTMDESQEVVDWCGDANDTPLGVQVSRAATLLAEAPLPAPLAVDTDWETAAHWLQAQYLPAYVCRAVADRLDETAAHVESFEAWLCENYPRLMRETRAGPHWFCHGADVIPQQSTVLLVLLDGVPFALTRWLQQTLAQSANLHLHQENPHIACLPTLTSVNKPCILSQRLPDQAPDSDGEALVASALGVPPERCRSITRLDDLATVTPGELAFYHHLPVDQDLLHKPSSALDRWLRAYALLEGLADRLEQLAQASRDAGVSLWLGCISDHGWTELPASAQVVEVPDHLNGDVTHRRVLQGIADDRYGIPLPHDRYFLAHDFTAARGYTALGRRPHGAVHGGLTPQEVAVLGFWATTALPEDFEPLTLQLEGTIRRAVSENPVSVTLGNPNPTPVTVTRFDLDGIAPDTGALPLGIPARSAGSIAANCDASRCKGAFRVHGAIQWRTEGGRPHSQPLDFSVQTSGAATTAPGFEDMLDV